MFPEIEIGSRPSGLFRVLLLRVGVHGILGSSKTKMAGQRGSEANGQRGSGEAAQRSSGLVANSLFILIGHLHAHSE